MRVGFTGLGTMGAHASRNILRRGFPLVVHDIREEAARPLIDMGAEWGTDPADVLARVDVVVTMVFGPKEVEQVARGENGLFSAPCGGKTWIDLTTSGPSLMRALGQEFRGARRLPHRRTRDGGGRRRDPGRHADVRRRRRCGSRARKTGDRGHERNPPRRQAR